MLRRAGDVGRWPEWQPAVERVDVLESDAAGGVLVGFEVDAKVRWLRYRTRYELEAPADPPDARRRRRAVRQRRVPARTAWRRALVGDPAPKQTDVSRAA